MRSRSISSAEGEIDVVLTDIAMGADGRHRARPLAAQDRPRVRVIVSSGHFQKENLVVLERARREVLLDKPYTADKLLRALRTVLEPA